MPLALGINGVKKAFRTSFDDRHTFFWRPPCNLLTTAVRYYCDRHTIFWRSSKDLRNAFFSV